jgi:hypothetical protein
MTFTLTLLGTDVSYQEKPDSFYTRGETLSTVSSLIKGEPCEGPSTDPITHRLNQAITVIKGPDTLGYEVGDRIARGVLRFLEAINQGENKLVMLGFSRGGVEAILIAHELQRLKQLIAQEGFDLSQAINSPCPYTKAAFSRDEDRKKLIDLLGQIAQSPKKMDEVHLALFNLDPVPGGTVFGAPTGWFDARYFEIPQIVDDYQQIVYENERSRGFKTLHTQPESLHTEFKLKSIPGHHGTGSGNHRDQNGRPLPSHLANKETHHVQQLVFLNMIDFLISHGVAIDVGRNKDLEPGLKALLEEYLNGPRSTQQLYLSIYNDIHANLEAYRHFNTTHYDYLDKEQSLEGLIYTIDPQRLLYSKDPSIKTLDKVIPKFGFESFVNMEHALLYFNEKMKLNGHQTLSAKVSNGIDFIVEVIEKHSRTTSPTGEDADYHWAEEGFHNDDRIVDVFFQQAVCALIDNVSSTYLDGNTLTRSEREELLKAVELAFNRLEPHSQTELGARVVLQMKQTLSKAVKTKFQSLIETTSSMDCQLNPQDHSEPQEPGTRDSAIIDGIALRFYAAKEPSEQVKEAGVLYSHLETFRTSLERLKKLCPELDCIEMSRELEAREALLVRRVVHYLNEKEIEDETQLETWLGSQSSLLAHLDPYFQTTKGTEELEEESARQKQTIARLERQITQLTCDAANATRKLESKGIRTGIQRAHSDLLPIINELKWDLSQVTNEKDALHAQTQRLKSELEVATSPNTSLHTKTIAIDAELQTDPTADANQEALDELRRNHDDLEARYADLGKKHEEEIKRANSPEEHQYLELILKKLIPHTLEYMKHLFTQASKINPAMSKEFAGANNWAAYSGKKEREADFHLLNDKFKITQALLNYLQDVKQFPLASMRVSQFQKLLTDSNKGLKEQRDAAWVRYSKNCFIAIAILFTGIIPGLIALLSCSVPKGKSPLFFADAKGKQFNDVVQKTLAKMTP